MKLRLNVISSLLAGVKTPANRYERCLYNDALTRSRKIVRPMRCLDTPLACRACAARRPRDCICSGIAALYGTIDAMQFAEFCGGVRSPYNPVYSCSDPADQVDLKVALENAVELLPGGISKLVQCRHIVKLAYIAAMSGLAATVEAAALYLPNNMRGLKHYLDNADVVHRGGQCPGTIVRGQIAVELPHYMKIAGSKIARMLSTCTGSLPTIQRRMILCKVVALVLNLASKKEYNAEGCGPYKCKRIVDIILLAGLSSRIAVPHIFPSDLLELAGLWPLPDGSCKGLKKIMPGLKIRTRKQQGLKALSLALGSGGKGKSVPVNAISAMLCFWNEHKNGVLCWVPEWCPE